MIFRIAQCTYSWCIYLSLGAKFNSENVGSVALGFDDEAEP